MKAAVKQFRMQDYRITEKNIDAGVDPGSYYKAIADFLTSLGPARIIGIQTPGEWYRWQYPITDVWYWEEER